MPKVVIRDRKLSYEEEGVGFPLIFSHGLLLSHRAWTSQFKALSQKYRCIGIDLWAHGESDTRPEKEISVKQLAEDTWSLIEALDLEKFSFVGMSLGGMIGIYLALTYPAHMHSLSVIAPYGGVEADTAKEDHQALLSEVAKAQGFPSEIRKNLASFIFSPKTCETHPELLEAYQEGLARFSPAQITTLMAIGRGIVEREDLRPHLASMRVPTQYLVGSDDLPTPPQEAQEMASLTPKSSYEVIPEAGHLSCLEQPDLVTQKIDDFIQQVSHDKAWKSVA